MSSSLASMTAIASGVRAACSAICTNTGRASYSWTVSFHCSSVSRRSCGDRISSSRDALLGIAAAEARARSGSSRAGARSSRHRTGQSRTRRPRAGIRRACRGAPCRESKRDQLPSRDREALQLVAGDPLGLARGDVVAEQNLEQRRVAPRALRVDHLDELLERQLLMGEAAQHRRPDALQQLGECRIAGQVGAQRERVREEAEQLRRLVVVSAGDGGADHEIVGAAVPVQERLERRSQHHEHRYAACAGQLAKRGHDLRRNHRTPSTRRRSSGRSGAAGRSAARAGRARRAAASSSSRAAPARACRRAGARCHSAKSAYWIGSSGSCGSRASDSAR